ncbi:hypothetical protein DITRI_Ditri02bG0023900 [Diplodiscus trichospermus]
MRLMQGMKDQPSKCESNLSCHKDSAAAAAAASSPCKQERRFCNEADSGALKAAAKNDRHRQAEEALRTVMYLSCWGPN